MSQGNIDGVRQNGYIMLTHEDQIGALKLKNGTTVIRAQDGMYLWGCFFVGNEAFLNVCICTEVFKPREKLDFEFGCISMPSQYVNRVWLNGEKIPYKLWKQIEGFFSEVYRLHNSEVFVALQYNPQTREWRPSIPNQKVSQNSVNYGISIAPSGFFAIGDVHSHAGSPAYHSTTDDSDEMDGFDGIHLVIGNLGSYARTYEASVMIGNERIPLQIDSLVDFPKKVPNFPLEWLERVEFVPPSSPKSWANFKIFSDLFEILNADLKSTEELPAHE